MVAGTGREVGVEAVHRRAHGPHPLASPRGIPQPIRPRLADTLPQFARMLLNIHEERIGDLLIRAEALTNSMRKGGLWCGC